jgi:hypothetical protein
MQALDPTNTPGGSTIPFGHLNFTLIGDPRPTRTPPSQRAARTAQHIHPAAIPPSHRHRVNLSWHAAGLYRCAVTSGATGTVRVYATHDYLVCRHHRRWLGSDTLKFPPGRQFSLIGCPDVEQDNDRHRRLIRRWGRATIQGRFLDAAAALQYWRQWILVTSDPSVAQRRHALGISDDAPPMSPKDFASWYPNAVALTDLFARQDHAIAHYGPLAPGIPTCARGESSPSSRPARSKRPRPDRIAKWAILKSKWPADSELCQAIAVLARAHQDAILRRIKAHNGLRC